MRQLAVYIATALISMLLVTAASAGDSCRTAQVQARVQAMCPADGVFRVAADMPAQPRPHMKMSSPACAGMQGRERQECECHQQQTGNGFPCELKQGPHHEMRCECQ
jgi:hypothetical protein